MNPLSKPNSWVKAQAHARRNFTKNLLAASALASVAPLGALAQTDKRSKITQLDPTTFSESVKRDLKVQRRSTFQSVLSDYFQTTNGMGTQVSLLLLAINDLPEPSQRRASARTQEWRESSFALVFRGPLEIPLAQNTYHLKHPGLGHLEIFLVPVGKVEKDAAGRDYEAVFNRVAE
jgi:hypothetical protein